MKKAWLIILFISCFLGNSNAQKLILKRICNSSLDNVLNWQSAGDTCILHGTIKIWARESKVFPFFGLDSGIVNTIKAYNHINANSPSKKDWEYFLEYYKICGGDTFQFHTDTFRVDDVMPDSTILDSVSVDPISNRVILGWTSNKTADFASYYLYNTDRSDPRLAENYKDTFYIDINPINPKTKPLTYDITSADSCDNRRSYGLYSHKTIHLTATVDSCIKKANLSWTTYQGWQTAITYIFLSYDGLNYILIDSVFPPQTTYTTSALNGNAQVWFFVRSIKQNSGQDKSSSSTSNSTNPQTTGVAINPVNTQIETVTLGTSNQVEVLIKRNPLSNYGDSHILRFKDDETATSIATINNSTNLFVDPTNAGTTKFNYKIVSENVCGIPIDTSTASNNIVLTLNENSGSIILNWNKYFTWNTGVKEYIIYRATGISEFDATNFTVWNTLTDTFSSDIVEDMISTKCYKVEAIENSPGNAKSTSNKICFSITGNIYFPNAIVIGGLNNTFQFKGPSINLQETSIQIYNRWGILIYNTSNFSNGWQGQTSNNDVVDFGLYIFIAKVKQGNNYVDLKGSIHVIQ